MRMSQLVGRTVREAPRDSELPSHKFLVRSGFVRQYSSGIWGFLPLAWRSIRKIEEICRQEMNRLGAQEIRMPTLATRELWEEAGRYSSVGKEMFRLKDRHEKDHVLCMTHEEPVVFLARTEITSYKQLPATLYQFQTKFRDEARPRGGLVRTREFIMKDAYSFHENEEDLLRFYEDVHQAYERFYKRLGFKKFASVKSDNGIFGGRFSHEFMALAPTGEDTLITCRSCSHKANVEVATTSHKPVQTSESKLEKVPTPGANTIAHLVDFFKEKTGPHFSAAHTAKAVLFQDTQKRPIVTFVRGDLDVVEQKIANVVGDDVAPADADSIARAGACAGATGPIGLDLSQCLVLVDPSVVQEAAVVTGANSPDLHYAGLSFQRDFISSLSESEQKNVKVCDIAQVVAGDECPECGGVLQETRGIEIGNIFHLGTKYSEKMDANFLDKNGKRIPCVMGCYGIGISRCLAALIEEHHDDHGMILPITAAPYSVQINALNMSDAAVKETSEKIYEALTQQGIEVLYDDRDEKAGSQFADADLIGVPIRVVVAPRSLKKGVVEIKFRDKSRDAVEAPIADVEARVGEIVRAEFARYEV